MPPAVLVYASATGTIWINLAQRLTGYRLILLDRPGRELSGPLSRPLLHAARGSFLTSDAARDIRSTESTRTLLQS